MQSIIGHTRTFVVDHFRGQAHKSDVASLLFRVGTRSRDKDYITVGIQLPRPMDLTEHSINLTYLASKYLPS
jgi:hypothetical protein